MAERSFPPLLDITPPAAPKSDPGRIKDLLMQDRRSLEENLTRPPAEMPEQRKDELREFYQQFNPPIPGSFLSQPVQVAALPEALADILSAALEDDAVPNTLDDEAVPQSFDTFLENIPLTQAQALQQAYLDQLNLAPAIQGMQQNIDEFEQAQIDAELAQLAQTQAVPLPTRSPFDMPLPVRSPISMPLPVRSPITMPLPVRSPIEMPLPARSPISMALPVRSPVDVLANIQAQQQAANLANIGLTPEDIEAQEQAAHFADIGLTPGQIAALEAQVDPFGFVSPDFELSQQVANFADIGLAPEDLADIAAQEQAAQMANIGLPPDVIAAIAAQEQAANFANIGLTPDDVEAQEQAENFANIGAPVTNESIVTLMPAMDVAPQPLTEQDLADIAAAEAEAEAAPAPLTGGPLGTSFGVMSPALAMSTVLTPPVNSPMAVGIASHESAQAEQAPFGSSLAEISNPAVMEGLNPISTAQISTLMSVDPQVAAAVFGEPEDTAPVSETYGGPPGLSAAITAASLTTDDLAPFSEAALGFDPLSDPISSVDPAAADDSGDDDDSSSGIDIGALGALTGIGDVDVSPASDVSDPGADAGADAGAAASDVSAPSDPGGGSGSGLGDAFGGAFSDAFSDPAWWKGGRVFNRGKANGGPVGLAALPPPPMDHMEDMPPEGEKVTKAEAGYQSKPNGREHCGMCAHYMDGACSIVKGRISPDGWSKYFEPA